MTLVGCWPFIYQRCSTEHWQDVFFEGQSAVFAWQFYQILMSLVLRFRCAVTSVQSCTRSSSQAKAITGTVHYDNLLLSVMDRAYAPTLPVCT